MEWGIVPKRVAKETWQKQKKRYYAKTRAVASRAYAKWSREERDLLLIHDIPDRELSKLLGRSMFAIQIQRHKLKNSTKGKNV